MTFTRETLRICFDMAPDAMLAVDRDSKVLEVNSASERMFGYARAALVGAPVEVLLPKDIQGTHAGHVQAYFRDLRRRPMSKARGLRARRKDGSQFVVDVSLNPVEIADGLCAVASVRDLTDHVRLETDLQQAVRDLERSNKDLEQFAYVASHDLQEPLRMVASYVQLLDRRYREHLDETAREFIGYAVEGTVRMKRLINDLLTYSRVGTHCSRVVPTDLGSIMDQVEANLEMAIKESHAEILRDALPEVLADDLLLTQLLQNLIGNAIKYRDKARPEIHVRADGDGGFWRISVRDNGIGFDPKHTERIFAVFQRLHAQQEYGGTGIGLAICKRIVEHHGGQIWVESEPSVGSTFYFTLPRQLTSTCVAHELADCPRR